MTEWQNKVNDELLQLGTLEGPEQWEKFKKAAAKNFKHKHQHVAKYLYCKINHPKSA